MSTNSAIQKVKDYIREPYAWPGGYAKVLYLSDGEAMCVECARSNFRQIVKSTKDNSRDGWQAVGVGVYWEGPSMWCAHCRKGIDSEYGDPENNGE